MPSECYYSAKREYDTCHFPTLFHHRIFSTPLLLFQWESREASTPWVTWGNTTKSVVVLEISKWLITRRHLPNCLRDNRGPQFHKICSSICENITAAQINMPTWPHKLQNYVSFSLAATNPVYFSFAFYWIRSYWLGFIGPFYSSIPWHLLEVVAIVNNSNTKWSESSRVWHFKEAIETAVFFKSLNALNTQ